jgi:hypothetical protein
VFGLRFTRKQTGATRKIHRHIIDLHGVTRFGLAASGEPTLK